MLLTWEDSETIDMTRAASLFMYGQQISSVDGVASVLSPFTISGLSDPTALAALWTQFEQLLNDPDGFVVPEEGITLDSGQTITRRANLEQFKQLIKTSVAPGAVLYRVSADTGLTNAQSNDLVGRLIDTGAPAGYEVHVAGESAFSHDFLEELDYWLPWVIAWIVVSSLVVFLLLLRSLVLPVLAVVVNLLTIAMSYGWLVLLFQGRHVREDPALHLDRGRRRDHPGADAVHPVRHHHGLRGVHAHAHARALAPDRRQPRERHRIGLVRSGRIIVSAALLVVIVTGAFAFTSIGTTKMLGLGIALAIIVDTLLVRLTLLPAVMVYLGQGQLVVAVVGEAQETGDLDRTRRCSRGG